MEWNSHQVFFSSLPSFNIGVGSTVATGQFMIDHLSTAIYLCVLIGVNNFKNVATILYERWGLMCYELLTMHKSIRDLKQTMVLFQLSVNVSHTHTYAHAYAHSIEKMYCL